MTGMTDDEYVDIVTSGLREAKSWTAQFNDAMQRAAQQESDNELVAAAFDADGYLRDLFIDPIAPAQYTHVELEELISAELRDGSIKQREAMRKVWDRFFGSDAPWSEIQAIAEDLETP
ncbi:hypothetical protein ACLILY_26105 [Mycobacterium sp. MS3]|uniref:hypothetical protein n=1 Tax=Mycobacterium sp. MS3 TaxID=3391378 RepID=UPI00398A26AC